MRRFEQWLDTALAVEDPPDGIDTELLAALTDSTDPSDTRPGHNVDSYTLWAAMTALTGEVKLQGRAFKELHNTLATQTSRMAEEIRVAYREREREVQRETERRSRRDVLAALIDVRDRLWRGVESARAVERETSRGTGRPWWARAFGTAAEDPNAEKLAALRKGYELGLERLDQTLAELNAHEIRCEGQLFDPRRMNAVDKEESTLVPEGTVLEVYRSGYEWSGEVFRPAQVKVSRRPGS
ncbi:MAG: nucleotide exchange factor GrpE [Acidobacteriota bacterium]